ncbi:hypothetical protein [Streptomyces sp. NPDC059491]|uniref:hypothetical protein n=1 Tax=Streptomyces sp. NPDC059491 TaxID=3346850 RepID=UPI0036CC2E07
MKITRYGELCPLCHTPPLLDVLQERSAQPDSPTVEHSPAAAFAARGPGPSSGRR